MQTLGIVNLTRDSFSDGGRFFAPNDAVAHAQALMAAGADFIDLGPASTHPDAEDVTPAEEVSRLEAVLPVLLAAGCRISVDSHHTSTQRWALSAGAVMLNDVRGFCDPGFYPELAASNADLVVMHAVGARSGRAARADNESDAVLDHLHRFFTERLEALDVAGVSSSRLILDPGMGFFLSRDPDVSLRVLAALPDLGRHFGARTLVSVSRKSFLQQTAGRDAQGSFAATLAAELYAAGRGVDFIRTHDVRALNDGWTVQQAIAVQAENAARPRRPLGVEEFA